MSDSDDKLQVPAGGCCPLRRNGLVPEFWEVVPSTPTALETIVEKVMAVVEALPCAPGEVEGVELALREALANAILHGNQADPTKKVIVACFCECGADGGMLLVVRDEGAGFDPSEVPDPTTAHNVYVGHGRGIFLMRNLMDEVRYLNHGSEVELRKRKDAAYAGNDGVRKATMSQSLTPAPAARRRS